MLLIFLDNAIKFSPIGGLVDVELTEELGKFALSVRDQGPGILELKAINRSDGGCEFILSICGSPNDLYSNQ